MAIVKLTSSGKGVQFVDDEGNVFMCPKSNLLKLLGGEIDVPFFLLSRLPLKCSPDRFKKSPLWSGGVKVEALRDKVNPDVTSSDVFSPKVKDAKDNITLFEDKAVW